MADLFKDPMYVFPVDEQNKGARTKSPGQASMTEVFAGNTTPTLRAADASLVSPGLYDVITHDGAVPRSPCGDNLISVVTREGDELFYPVVHGRAGGSIPGQSSVGTEPLTSNMAARADVASRAHRHASLIAASVSSHFGAATTTNAEETPEERAEAYQHSRATPSSIQRHRRGSSRGCSRSPPPTVALRGEAVEDTVRATSSQLPSASSSLANTPRQSLRRTPVSSPLHELSSLDGGLRATPASAAGTTGRRSHAVVDGVEVRVEETGVSTPEMAEYFAEGAVDAQLRQSSSSIGGNPFGSSSSSLPSRRAFVTPRHSQQYGTSAMPPHSQAEGSGVASAAGPRVNHFVLDRLMHLIEEQSRVSQQLLQRMDAMESTNKTLLDRLNKLEAAVESGNGGRDEVAMRVSAADSASPSVTRTSGSMDSAARPSTRAPSKAVS